MKCLFGHFLKAGEPRAAARENEASGNVSLEASALKIVTNEREKLSGARFEDVGEHASKNRARGAITHACDFNGSVLVKERAGSAAVPALDPLGFRDRRTQTDGKIVGEVIAADGDVAGVVHNYAAVNDAFRSTAADIEQAAAKLAFVLRECGFC